MKSLSFTFGIVLFVSVGTLSAAPRRLTGHVPAVVARGEIAPMGRVPGTNQMRLAISLPLRDAAALTNLLRDIYDPASPQFHHYLTPAAFAGRFGPTPADYAAVARYAQTNGLAVVATHSNRLVLDVTGRAADVERAFHVRLNSYRHPKAHRNFFAPDAEPSVADVPAIMHISGLNNYSLPRPRLHPLSATVNGKVVSRSGSGPGGSYMGNDFRAAYVPGTVLTGAGQSVGLLQFDGFHPGDIINYASAMGLSNVPPVVVVPVDGGVSTPGDGEVEVALDIEMALSMAPGIASIYVYEAPNGTGLWVDLLSQMADDNLACQLSCSWGGGESDAALEQIFLQMAAQGQSFFDASGDDDAFTGTIDFPSESPNITQVGGTMLTTDGSGNYVSETVWNRNNNYGSSGGISTTVAIPTWQLGISMTANQGSTTMRNIPDVALTAENVYVIYGDGQTGAFGGTSCAAPLWAGYTALINQQAVVFGRPAVGFLNPAIYELGKGTTYPLNFHDVTTGNNTNATSGNKYFAANGYDLCTGWGTPVGQYLINSLIPPDALTLTPLNGFNAGGFAGGPFSPGSQNFFLTNSDTHPLTWSLINTSSWLTASVTGGILAAGATQGVAISLSAAANRLAVGGDAANIQFTNWNSHAVQTLQFSLQVLEPLAITPATGCSASGLVGGPFSVTPQNFTLSNQAVASLNWGIANTSVWLEVSPTSGTLAGAGQARVAVSLNSAANNLPAGIFTSTVGFTNQTSGMVQSRPFTLSIGQSIALNGGFETGDFTGWTLVGDTIIDNMYYNAVVDEYSFSDVVHSGNYGVLLGEGGYLATLTQTLPTVAHQRYQLSFWLDNPISGSGQQFIARWNGAELINLDSPPAFAWTNFQFMVAATGTNAAPQFAARNDPNYFGFDDVSVQPVPPVVFGNVAASGGNLQFSWNALAGLKYQIEFTTNLAPVVWQNLATVTANTNVAGFMDTNVLNAGSRRFYRLVLP